MPSLRRAPSQGARRRFTDAAALERHSLVAQLKHEAQTQALPKLVALQRRRHYLELLEELHDEELRQVLRAKGDAASDAITARLHARTERVLDILRERESAQGVLMHTATLHLSRPEEVLVYADSLVVTRVRRLAHATDTETIPFHAVAAVTVSPEAATLCRVVLSTTEGEKVLTLPRRDASQLLVIIERWQGGQVSPHQPEPPAAPSPPRPVERDLAAGETAPLHPPPPV